MATTAGARAVASVTVPLPASLDASAAVLAARGPGDRWFCLEQPDRDHFALATLGAAYVIEARGPDRFREAACDAQNLGRRTFADDPGRDPDRPAASGPVLTGGFAFSPEGGRAPEWSSFAPALLVLPEVSLARGRGEARMTVNAAVDGTEPVEAVLRRVQHRLASLHPARMPLLDPDPVGRPRVASATPPAHFEHAVAQGVDRIRAGELEKIVLAREVRVHSRSAADPAPCWGRCARCSRPASASASARRRARSSARRRSCWCGARALAPRPWRWPGRPAAAPTRPSTIISASSLRARPRTVRSRRSWRAGSSARWPR